MKLLYIALVVVAILAVSIEGAKKKKNNHKDRDQQSSHQLEDQDQQANLKKEEDTVARSRASNGRDRKEKDDEKPLKKAEDESSSEEEEEKKENQTTPAPKRIKRKQYDDGGPDHMVTLYRLKRSNVTEETNRLSIAQLEEPLNSNFANVERAHTSRRRRAEHTLHKAKEMDELPLNNNNNNKNQKDEHAVRHRPKRTGNTLKKEKEMDHIPLNPSPNEESQKSRSRRAENSHAQTGEVILTRAQELNDGERTSLVTHENAGSRPDYRKKSRTRRNGEISDTHEAESVRAMEHIREENVRVKSQSQVYEDNEQRSEDRQRVGRHRRTLPDSESGIDKHIEEMRKMRKYDDSEHVVKKTPKRRIHRNGRARRHLRDDLIADALEWFRAIVTVEDMEKLARKRRTVPELTPEELEDSTEYRHAGRVRRTLHGSSEEDTLKKAEELNGGERRPVDKQPSQSQMPETHKAHKRRSPRHLNSDHSGQSHENSAPLKIIHHPPGNARADERDTEEWKLENEEDYDNGGNY